jgi:hypothetical protein
VAPTPHPSPGLMKIDAFGVPFGLTPGMSFVALVGVLAGLPTTEISAWTRQHRHASRTTSQSIPLPSRFRLGSSDAAATVGRRNTRSLRSSASDSNSASPMFAVVEPTGEARPKRPVERQRSFGPRMPRSKLNSTSWTTRLKKKVADHPASVQDLSFGEIPATHGYPCGIIALFLGLVQLGVSLRATSRVLEFIARFFDLPFSAPDWTTGRMWLLRFGFA